MLAWQNYRITKVHRVASCKEITYYGNSLERAGRKERTRKSYENFFRGRRQRARDRKEKVMKIIAKSLENLCSGGGGGKKKCLCL
jgi:hypothetical protein